MIGVAVFDGALREQWLLHVLFKPERDWSGLELLQHRDRNIAELPSLPHQEGQTLSR